MVVGSLDCCRRVRGARSTLGLIYELPSSCSTQGRDASRIMSHPESVTQACRTVMPACKLRIAK